MRELLSYEERIGRADVDSREAFQERAAEARAVLATLIGADPDAVELVPGATAGMAWAAELPAWRPGQRIVTTDREHPAVLAMLETLAARHDLQLVRVPIDAATDEADLVARFGSVVDRRTGLLAVSHVTWDTGTVLPVARLAALARAAGAWSVVDGAQAVGAIAVDVPTLGADVYAFSGYKWLLGPHGVGGLWRSTRALAAAGPPATTLHRPSVIALGRTVGWLEMHVGLHVGARAFGPPRRGHRGVARGRPRRGAADARSARGDARRVPHRRLALVHRSRGPGPARVRHLRGPGAAGRDPRQRGLVQHIGGAGAVRRGRRRAGRRDPRHVAGATAAAGPAGRRRPVT